jgi:hypothetical protein
VNPMKSESRSQKGLASSSEVINRIIQIIGYRKHSLM